MSLLRQYNCGCIAFATTREVMGHVEHLVVRPCDYDEPGTDIDLFWRHLLDPGDGEPLDGMQELLLFERVREMIGKGFKYDRVRKLLGVKI